MPINRIKQKDKTMNLKKNMKIYINQFGIFYEGQILDNYDRYGYFIGKIQLKKFIIHYKKLKKRSKKSKIPVLYINVGEPNKTINYTLSVKHLGVYYKIPKSHMK